MKRILFMMVFITVLWPLSISAQSIDNDERLKEVTLKHQVKLSDNQINLVQQTCSAQSNKIRLLQTENDQAITKRIIIYSNIQKELIALELRLAKQGADASELDLMIGDIDQQLSNLRSLGQRHSDITNDLISLNCQDNPDLFVGGLEELREIRKNTLNQAKSLKDTILQSPNKTFNPLIERLLI